jgi:ribose 1,5-bisphosphokinase PhnN
MTLEMTSVDSTAHNPYKDKEVIDISAVNPMLKNKNKNNGRENWNKLKKVLKSMFLLRQGDGRNKRNTH